jgi:hypothetical protein
LGHLGFEIGVQVVQFEHQAEQADAGFVHDALLL